MYKDGFQDNAHNGVYCRRQIDNLRRSLLPANLPCQKVVVKSVTPKPFLSYKTGKVQKPDFWRKPKLDKHEQEQRLFPFYRLPIETVAQLVAKHFHFSEDDLKYECRATNYVQARQCFCWLTFHFSDYPLSEIASYLKRDHTTLIHNRRVVDDSLSLKTGRLNEHIKSLKIKCRTHLN